MYCSRSHNETNLFIMSQLNVSIIIVNFNGGHLLIDCVRSALQSSVPVEVLVSDNGSTDGSVEALEQGINDERLYIYRNDANLGFSVANNRMVPQASGDFLLFLNPDCIIRPDTLERMCWEMDDHPDAGMSGCLIVNSDGSEQAGCRRRVPTPWRTLVRVFHLGKLFTNHKKFEDIALSQQPLPDSPVELEAISGAFMLVRRTALEEVGMLDEGYFLHCEDLDWCMRFRMKGWKILFVPGVEVMHTKGECSKGRAIRVEWHKHKGMVRFYLKFFRHQYPLPLMMLVIALVWSRFMAIAMVENFRRFLAKN